MGIISNHEQSSGAQKSLQEITAVKVSQNDKLLLLSQHVEKPLIGDPQFGDDRQGQERQRAEVAGQYTPHVDRRLADVRVERRRRPSNAVLNLGLCLWACWIFSARPQARSGTRSLNSSTACSASCRNGFLRTGRSRTHCERPTLSAFRERTGRQDPTPMCGYLSAHSGRPGKVRT